MPKLVIDGVEIEVPAGSTVLQAIQAAKIQIPVFCYNEKLSIAGNCRMCLVELEGAPKPIASCAMPAGDNMVIRTDSDIVDKARKGALEFLLANHPLDCPTCDQGGECDLQDITMEYGRGESRFDNDKRAVSKKHMGPLINTEMNRCIHCTRCVRFMEEIAGVPEMGAINRGENMQIITYLERTLSSELSGNIVDLCPVGALTSRPYKYKARPWELAKTYSIDVMDATGSNIRIDSVGDKVLRILPRSHEGINEDWLADRSRHIVDGLSAQRIDSPYVRKHSGALLERVSWNLALDTIRRKLESIDLEKETAAIAGDMADVESMLCLRELFVEKFGSMNIECRQDGAYADPSVRSSYIFNSSIKGIDEADFILIIGGNIRKDSPIINARIRKRYLSGELKVARIGSEIKQKYGLTYGFEDLGNDLSVLEEILQGSKSQGVVKDLSSATQPMIIISQDALVRKDAESLVSLCVKIAEKYGVINDDESWNGFNILQKRASVVGGLDIGFAGKKSVRDIIRDTNNGKVKFLYLLGADEIPVDEIADDCFVVYQGSHGDKGAAIADVVLPGVAYTEKSATYVNTEGRAQRTYKAVNAPNYYSDNGPRDDWQIIQNLSISLGVDLGYKNIDDVRCKMSELSSVFANLGEVVKTVWKGNFAKYKKIDFNKPLENIDYDYYMNDYISRYSKTMLECSLAANRELGVNDNSYETCGNKTSKGTVKKK